MATAPSNITARGARRRLRFGLFFAAMSAALLAFLLAADAPRVTRLALAAPVWLAAYGLLQAREKT